MRSSYSSIEHCGDINSVTASLASKQCILVTGCCSVSELPVVPVCQCRLEFALVGLCRGLVQPCSPSGLCLQQNQPHRPFAQNQSAIAQVTIRTHLHIFHSQYPTAKVNTTICTLDTRLRIKWTNNAPSGSDVSWLSFMFRLVNRSAREKMPNGILLIWLCSMLIDCNENNFSINRQINNKINNCYHCCFIFSLHDLVTQFTIVTPTQKNKPLGTCGAYYSRMSRETNKGINNIINKINL